MLSPDEKKYLWNKIEYTKKKKATETENDLFTLLNTNKNVTKDDFLLILNSLEYSFKKKLMESDLNNEFFKSIKEKLPEEFFGVKYSNLKQQRNKKPNIHSSKQEIIDYLSKNKTEYNNSMTKSELLDLFEHQNILTFKGFLKLS